MHQCRAHGGRGREKSCRERMRMRSSEGRCAVPRMPFVDCATDETGRRAGPSWSHSGDSPVTAEYRASGFDGQVRSGTRRSAASPRHDNGNLPRGIADWCARNNTVSTCTDLPCPGTKTYAVSHAKKPFSLSSRSPPAAVASPGRAVPNGHRSGSWETCPQNGWWRCVAHRWSLRFYAPSATA